MLSLFLDIRDVHLGITMTGDECKTKILTVYQSFDHKFMRQRDLIYTNTFIQINVDFIDSFVRVALTVNVFTVTSVVSVCVFTSAST